MSTGLAASSPAGEDHFPFPPPGEDVGPAAAGGFWVGVAAPGGVPADAGAAAPTTAPAPEQDAPRNPYARRAHDRASTPAYASPPAYAYVPGAPGAAPPYRTDSWSGASQESDFQPVQSGAALSLIPEASNSATDGDPSGVSSGDGYPPAEYDAGYSHHPNQTGEFLSAMDHAVAGTAHE